MTEETKPITGIGYSLSIIKSIITHAKNWPEFFYKHLTKAKGKMILKMRNGYKMEIRPYHSEASIIMDIWALKFYNPEGFDINETDTIIDIGGHIGSFSVYAASQAKKGRVFIFEPLTENFAAIKKNIRLNRIKNIHPIQLAVASKKGTQKFYVFDDENSGTSNLYKLDNGHEIKVKTITLPEVIKKHKIKRIDFMKIDCEGAEYEILFTLPKEIIDSIGKVSMEYHEGVTKYGRKDLLAFFKKHGFETRVFGTYLYAKKR